jgi:hypothetical protein
VESSNLNTNTENHGWFVEFKPKWLNDSRTTEYFFGHGKLWIDGIKLDMENLDKIC